MTGGKSSDDATKVTYSIDIRVFLVVIVSGMALAFGVGVAFGPSAGSEFAELISSKISPPSNELLDKNIKSVKRQPTKHSSDIGEKIIPQSDLNMKHVNFDQPSLEDLGDGVVKHYPNSKSGSSDGDDEEHLPAGQHLLVDIKNVEAAFLNSEERLAGAMVEVIQSAGLTLLSYHCHSLIPAGVSCVGVLLESHISFHTWPDEGVITLDLFTCGSNPLLPVLPELERLFGIPRTKSGSTELEKIVTLWSHELRGFRDSSARKKHHLDGQSDLASWVVSLLEVLKKEQIVSTLSPFQRIDIWDILDIDDTPTYNDAVKHNLQEGDPRWLTSELVTPERYLFLDGTIQMQSHSEREFHEALVHPAMFTHSNPEHVAIVGGGEGAVLREVLKHKTVKSVTMIEIDHMMVDIARKHLPFMSNCTDLIGVADVCFEDERADIIYDDGRAWFVDHFGKGAKKIAAVDKFDVIIMDALDPEHEKNVISDRLYNDGNFIDSLFNSLSESGVIAIKVGNAPNIHDPRADMGVYHVREKLFQLLENHQESAEIFVYEEPHCGWPEPRSFVVVCKDSSCRSNWHASTDVIDYQIYERIVDTQSDNSPLIHFDGATQFSYQIPPKAWETVYCRREPTPFECDYIQLDPLKEIYEFDIDDLGSDNSDFEIKTVVMEDGKEVNSVYAIVNIPKGSYIMPEDLAASFTIHDESKSNLIGNTKIAGTGKVSVIEDFLEFIDEHGHRSFASETGLTYVEVGGTHLIRRVTNEAASNVGRWMPRHPSGKIPVYSPVYERHMMSFDVFLVATKDIEAGEELVRLENMWDI
uniref:PABS domain-containing protein n=1 Tax=Eucampia antarctica TaxID=49252 RepID=A0A7S2R241_9STRA|mmetsp:Transcript_14285/g.13797  ORF Transcript_14285/g.13797 Transcript_14285/m.13797 type:complete len:811 (+) Transcript_14285:168-2600(+)|eukprot:CAMPEP_0197831692 /NCGR_PEP_ID=MMETSP1437-20131217/11571_1 /TAXON_ID=49252 ORGANISM="Eucampia antarctica, Strain CCMP1452" /NCGR_SAMPLE_ID=MMETSP1437 /ASSEMBLY_ACC=CAM_ASM_001096 /LENGTH=810 /DNA_ID=CAMNT_0043434717 /DNA_START=166 /DNA_END=2598 /DNA_ORIENTATION=+